MRLPILSLLTPKPLQRDCIQRLPKAAVSENKVLDPAAYLPSNLADRRPTAAERPTRMQICDPTW